MVSNDVLLYPEIGTYSICHQRRLIQQLVETDATENNSQTLDRAKGTLKKWGDDFRSQRCQRQTL